MSEEKKVVGTCPNCGADMVVGKFGAYCVGRCGFTIGKVYGTAIPVEKQITLLKGGSIHVSGLISKKTGKAYEAIFTPNGLKQYTYENKDGETKNGCCYSFNVEFPPRKNEKANKGGEA